MSLKWKNVYKKVVEVNGEHVVAVYFFPRYKNRMPVSQWIRLKFIEWLITPFLLTKDEVGERGTYDQAAF